MTADLRTRRRCYYLDTSAWLAGVLRDPAGLRIFDEVQGAELVASVLLLVEAHRNLVRLAREGRLDALQLQQALDRLDRDREMFDLQEVTVAFACDRTMPAVTTPKSLDLIHLRTALHYHRQRALTRFISLDEQRNRAARELGLPT